MSLHATTEPCVLCGIDTGVPITLSVDRREHYIEGAGQLCRDCHHCMYIGICKCPQPEVGTTPVILKTPDWVM